MPKTPSHLASSPFRQPAYLERKREEFRANVRGVACPLCKEGPGRRCVTPDGEGRESNHMERVSAYEAATGDRSGSQAWRARRARASKKRA